MSWVRVSLAGLMIVTVVAVLLVFRESLFAEQRGGIGIQAAACCLMFWARIALGKRSFHASAAPTEGGLVSSGPYRYLRHPIYAAVLFFIWAGVLSHFSAVNFTLGGAVTLGLILRILAEERLMGQRYPEYAEYLRRTKRIVPFIF